MLPECSTAADGFRSGRTAQWRSRPRQQCTAADNQRIRDRRRWPTGTSLLAASVATTIDGTPFALWRADPMARQYTDDYGTRWTLNGTAWEWRDANALQIGGPQASDVITGSGFPEGVVTAPIGQRYIDTAATAGAIEWIKASGAGNTGWKLFGEIRAHATCSPCCSTVGPVPPSTSADSATSSPSRAAASTGRPPPPTPS